MSEPASPAVVIVFAAVIAYFQFGRVIFDAIIEATAGISVKSTENRRHEGVVPTLWADPNEPLPAVLLHTEPTRISKDIRCVLFSSLRRFQGIVAE
jgi:hypothetical protein